LFIFCVRVKDYIKGGIHLSKLQDPDGGLNIARKRAKLSVLDEITTAKLPSSFPSDGFLEDVSLLPEINYGVIWRYMIETCDAKKQLSTAKPLVKGFNFFKSGHVLSIQY